MAIYSEPVSDEKLLEKLGGVKSVGIAGCRGCANVSLAFLRDLPLFKIFSLAKPIAMLQEIMRIGEILNENGIRVEKVWGVSCVPTSYLSPCLIGLRRRNLQRDCKGIDAVITMCCIGGHYEVYQALKDLPVKVVTGMKSVGGINNPIKIKGGKIVLEREKVKVFTLGGS